jgi:hypothetical protein
MITGNRYGCKHRIGKWNGRSRRSEYGQIITNQIPNVLRREYLGKAIQKCQELCVIRGVASSMKHFRANDSTNSGRKRFEMHGKPRVFSAEVVEDDAGIDQDHSIRS